MRSLILIIVLLQATTIVGCGAEATKLDNELAALNASASPSPSPTPSGSPSSTPVAFPMPSPTPMLAPQIQVINNTTINSSSTTTIITNNNHGQVNSYPQLKVEGSHIRPQFFPTAITWLQAVAITPPGYRLATTQDLAVLFRSGTLMSLGKEGQGVWTSNEALGNQAWSANLIEGTTEITGKQTLLPAIYVPQ